MDGGGVRRNYVLLPEDAIGKPQMRRAGAE